MADGIWVWLTLGRGVDEPNWWTLRAIQQRVIDTTAGGVHQLRSSISVHGSNKKMTRVAHLEPYLSSFELKNRYREATHPVEGRRWQLLWLISLGWTIKEAAKVIGINYYYAKEIVKGYNQQGEIAILRKKLPQKKRPSHALLNTLQLEELHLTLKGGSPERGVWNVSKVALWIAQKTGRQQVGKQRDWEYLKKCGYSPQRPRPRHKQGELIEQELFKKNCPFE